MSGRIAPSMLALVVVTAILPACASLRGRSCPSLSVPEVLPELYCTLATPETVRPGAGVPVRVIVRNESGRSTFRFRRVVLPAADHAGAVIVRAGDALLEYTGPPVPSAGDPSRDPTAWVTLRPGEEVSAETDLARSHPALARPGTYEIALRGYLSVVYIETVVDGVARRRRSHAVMPCGTSRKVVTGRGRD